MADESCRSVVLIVDDNVLGREALADLLEPDGYALRYAANGAEALQLAAEMLPDVILLDVMMPDVDGFEVCLRLRQDARLAEVPVIMVTALDDRASRLQGIEAGADDFVSKPFDRVELRARIRTITRLNRYRKLREENLRLQAAYRELESTYAQTITGWAQALDLRDRETEGHSERVAAMTVRLARAAGIEGDALTHIFRGAVLHDIGKLGIPDSILLKKGPLDEEEWVVMRLHPVHAYEWLSPIEFLRPALDIPYCHHERWDGTGYPRGLKGEAIPLSARMFAVIDVWDALSFDRPYRSAWPRDRVLRHLEEASGSHFDPEVVRLFLRTLGSE